MPYPHENQGDGQKRPYKELMGIRESKKEGGKGFWSRIGIATENRDGSWTLWFDYFPCNIAETKIQMRDPRPREGKPTTTTQEDF